MTGGEEENSKRETRDEMVEVVEGRLWGQIKERVRQTLNSGEEVLKN